MSGEGKNWSAGHDLGTPEEMEHRKEFPIEDGTRGIFERSWRLYVDMHLRWRNVAKPMICAVHGYCIFGGWMVASTADIIFAADDALFLGSAFQYFSIPYDIHHRKAKEFLFQSKFIDAQQAKEMGFVNRVVPRDEADGGGAGLCRRRRCQRSVRHADDEARDQPGAGRAGLHRAHHVRALDLHQPPYGLEWTRATRCANPRDTGKKRMPMVQVALERYKRDQDADKK